MKLLNVSLGRKPDIKAIKTLHIISHKSHIIIYSFKYRMLNPRGKHCQLTDNSSDLIIGVSVYCPQLFQKWLITLYAG